LSQFEQELLVDESNSGVTIRVQFPSSYSEKTVELVSTEDKIDHSNLIHLLKLILESGVLNWSTPVDSKWDDRQAVYMNLGVFPNGYYSGGYYLLARVPLKRMEKSLAFREFLNAMKAYERVLEH
jgi:hypothetical protein